MKISKIISFLIFAFPFFALAEIYIPPTEYADVREDEYGKYILSYADTALSPSSTAVHKDSPKFVDWAAGWKDLSYGANCDERWRTPQNACGKASDSVYDIVCLGEGGRITMTFDNAICDGDGYDFAVFENSFGDYFLELAFVEVSSDGVHFVRFPNFYLGSEKVGANGVMMPSYIYNLASKYKVGYGHPFDISELQYAYDYSVSNPDAFSAEYAKHLADNLPYLDKNNVRYVRIIDIVSDGSVLDSGGWTIFDPTPSTGSAGFDLNAIGVINSKIDTSKIPQSIIFPDIPDMDFSAGKTLVLEASATSGLEVDYEIISGDATILGNILTLGQSPSTIVIKAYQSGDDAYASASPVYKTFSASDLSLQTITFAPIADRTPADGLRIPLNARASSGLKVSFEVVEGDADLSVLPAQTYLVLSSSEAGQIITVRAMQNGDETHAPARPVHNTFAVVDKVSYQNWAEAYGAVAYNADSNSDGWQNVFSYAFGVSPLEDNSLSLPSITVGGGKINISWRVAAFAYEAEISPQISFDEGASWSVPEVSATGVGIENSNVTRSFAASVSAPQYGTVLVRFAGRLGSGQQCVSKTHTLEIALGYSAWASSCGLSGDRAIASATPFSDGRANLEKYALGLDGSKPASISSDSMGVYADSLGVHFRFALFKYAENISVKIRYSTDLKNWHCADLPPAVSCDAKFDRFDFVAPSISQPASPLFFRLEIAETPD